MAGRPSVLTAAEGDYRAIEGEILFLAPHSTVMGILPLTDGRAEFFILSAAEGQPRRPRLDSFRVPESNVQQMTGLIFQVECETFSDKRRIGFREQNLVSDK